MERFIELIKQYRYGVLILMLGIGLMLIPGKQNKEEPTPASYLEDAPDIQSSLEQILSKMDGVGKVSVLLTQSAGEITVYQKNTDQSGENLREDTVIVTDGSRGENGLIRQVIPARYQGAIVVCQGGDRATVRLAVVEAVSAVTGLTSDKISVLKMK